MPDYRLNVPNPTNEIFQSFELGQKLRGQAEQRQQAQAQAEVVNRAHQEFDAVENKTFADYEKIINVLPKGQAESMRANWTARSKEYQQNQLQSAGSILAAFESSPEIAISLMEERAIAEENAGDMEAAEYLNKAVEMAKVSPEVGKMTMGMIVASMPGGKDVIDNLAKLRGGGRGAGAGEKAFQPVTIVNEATGEKKLVFPVHDPKTGKGRLEPANFPDGFVISKETPTEKRQAEIATVGAKKGAEVTGKGIAQRRQVAIDFGLTSSEGLANLKRAKTLLDTVKTGGIDAASLRAKQLFGVEGADEGELSNRLGKAVLSQLRETFGAAFTAQEGASLERIEAGFKKSPEANKRLIEQLIKMVEKKSKQGISAAVAAEDFDAAKRIKENMSFSLDTEEEPAATAPKRLKFNPATGVIE